MVEPEYTKYIDQLKSYMQLVPVVPEEPHDYVFLICEKHGRSSSSGTYVLVTDSGKMWYAQKKIPGKLIDYGMALVELLGENYNLAALTAIYRHDTDVLKFNLFTEEEAKNWYETAVNTKQLAQKAAALPGLEF